jgi:hypothetical protein
MNRPTVRLHVEEMESRFVPSGAPLTHPGLGAALVTHDATVALALGGTISGTYTTSHTNPDAGTQYTLNNGSGTLNVVGKVTATGTLQSVGMIASGQAGGTVTLKTASKDAITLQLTGPHQKGFAHLPTHFTYKVTKATGQFASLMGQQGMANLTLGTAAGSTPGSFNLVIHPKA